MRGVDVSRKFLLMGVASLLLSLSAVFFVAAVVLRPAHLSARTGSEEAVLFDAGEYTTNLSDAGYVKAKISLELSDKSLEKEVSEKLPVLQDRILHFLNGKSREELLYADNREEIKKELLDELNSCLPGGEIKNVYFYELVVQ